MAVNGLATPIFEVTSSTDVVSSLMTVASCRWTGATTAGHVCYVVDSDGNPIFYSVANGANFIDGWVFDRKIVGGLKFSTAMGGTGLDSGTVTFYKANI